MHLGRRLLAGLVVMVSASMAAAQGTTDQQTRAGTIEAQQSAKAAMLVPKVPSRAEHWMKKAEDIFINDGLHWHPFFEGADLGSGFAPGIGYRHHVSAYNTVDVRGSYSIRSYKRAEVEFDAPRIFRRHGQLSVLGGWREATEVAFFGLGMDVTADDRASFAYTQPYASALIELLPTRKYFILRGGLEWTQWRQQPGAGEFPSVESRYSPATLPGVGASPTYIHTQAGVGFDWRPASGYARRGGYYAATFHHYRDRDKVSGFQRLDYEIVQHIPVLREAWVLSLHAKASTTEAHDGQATPFFLLPYLGGGSTLRGYGSHRFRDRNSLLLQAEWRIMNNRFFDSAFFVDAGKVTSRRADLNFDGLETDVGFGVRFHGPTATPLRIDIAKGRDGLKVVFGSSHVF